MAADLAAILLGVPFNRFAASPASLFAPLIRAHSVNDDAPGHRREQHHDPGDVG
jgi:hypothetical protein